MKFVILDSNAIVHRAFHAIPELTNKRGEPTGAIYGFISVFIKMINDLKPDYLVACFDLPEQTFRHKKFADYKAHRPKTPEELNAQFPKIKEFLILAGVPVLEKPGFEADDILGTISEQLYLKSKIKNQKSKLQLKIKNLEKEKENIQAIIVTGDLDTLQLINNNTEIYTMRRGMTDIVIYDKKAVKERYGLIPEQLTDYKGLVGDQSDNIPGVKGIGNKTATQLLQKYNSLENLFKHLKEVSRIKGMKSVSIKLESERDMAFFSKELSTINCETPIEFNLENAKWEGLNIKKVEPFLEDNGFRSLIRRIKGEITEPVKQRKIKPKDIKKSINQGNLFTTQSVTELPIVKSSEVEPPKVEKTEQNKKIALWLLNSNLDGDETLEELKKRLKTNDLLNVYNNIELPLITILDEMSKVGIKISLSSLKVLQKDLKSEIENIRQEIFKLANIDFNPSSPQQVAEVLFDKLEISSKGVKKTPSGKISTKESELFKIASKHEIVPYILRFRELEKLLTTYVNSLFDKLDKNNRVHTTFNQIGAITGRLSSVNPNLQNIPAGNEYFARKVKNIFIPEKGYNLVSFDYSQVELRIAAHLSGDKTLIKAFNERQDIHTITASEIFGIKQNKVTKEQRRQAKVFNFGILYGMSSYGLSERLHIPVIKAQTFIDNYFLRFSGIHDYFDKIKSDINEKGYVETIFGRKRFFLDGNIRGRQAMFREAINAPIQGSAADIIKIAMIKLNEQKIIDNEKCRLLLQIHDDLLFEIKKDKVKELAPKIKKIMEEATKLKVPIVVDVKAGDKWGNLSEFIN